MPMQGPSSAPPRRLQSAAKLEVDGLLSVASELIALVLRSGLLRRNVTGLLLPNLDVLRSEVGLGK